jgi:xylan 1,4-beta-xylosidase
MKVLSRCVLLFLLFCGVASAEKPAIDGFRTLQVDAGRVAGEIRSFQGLNGPPAPVITGLPDLVQQYKALRADQVRTHDFMGPTEIDSKFDYKNKYLAWLVPDLTQRAGVVKAGNASIIFPDMTADPEKPESYNFSPTDKVLAAIRASGAEIYYRVGRSWGANDNPPDDPDKFADVVKHIAMHYNQGWANGFHYEINYWEFWNEPDGIFWSGTPEQFYSLYEKIALALKSVDPALKVGGDGLAVAYTKGPYREGFLDYCVAHRVPLDFYSWHVYTDLSADPYDAVRLAGIIRGILDKHGFPLAESILSEWNLTPDFSEAEKAELQGMHNAAYIGAVLSYIQHAHLDHAHFYRGDAAWMGLFDLQGQYFKTAYAFKAMGQMLDTPQRLPVTGADTFGFATLAGRSADGNTVQILISNYAIPAGYKPKPMQMPAELQQPGAPASNEQKHELLPGRTDIVYRDNSGYNLTVNNLPWGKGAFTVKRYRISNTENLKMVEEKSGEGGIFKLSNAMSTDNIELVVLQSK